MNVAVTRAKRLCVLIGDSHTVSANSFLESLCKHFRQHGKVRTAFDYAGNPNVRAMYGVKSGSTSKKQEETKDATKKVTTKPADKTEKKQKPPKEEAKATSQPTAVDLFKKPKLDLTEAEQEEVRIFNEQRREELMRQLTEFKEDQSKQELVFSEKLTSFERQLVHEIAE